jgi:RNA polymerase sigma factor (sigma-70 family)
MARHYARRCGEDADDLLQEAWLGLLEALPNLNPTIGSAEQYLLRCARWRMLDSIRRVRRRRCNPLDPADAEQLPAPPRGSPEEGVVVEEFLAGLPTTQQALVRCLLAGLTWREAGARLGFTSANVAYHIRRVQRRWEHWEEYRRAGPPR